MVKLEGWPLPTKILSQNANCTSHMGNHQVLQCTYTKLPTSMLASITHLQNILGFIINIYLDFQLSILDFIHNQQCCGLHHHA